MVPNTEKRAREQSDGVPVHVEGDREVLLIKRRGRWRALFVALWLPMAAGCGAGSAEPSYQVQGAVRAFTSGGPVDVIVVRRGPAVSQ